MESHQTPSSSDVNPYAAPVANVSQHKANAAPIFKTWLIYAAVMTGASWIISTVLGVTAFRWLMAGGSGRYWLIPVLTLAVTLPVSYVVFRWAVTRFLLDSRQ